MAAGRIQVLVTLFLVLHRWKDSRNSDICHLVPMHYILSRHPEKDFVRVWALNNAGEATLSTLLSVEVRSPRHGWISAMERKGFGTILPATASRRSYKLHIIILPKSHSFSRKLEAMFGSIIPGGKSLGGGGGGGGGGRYEVACLRVCKLFKLELG